LKGRLGAIFAAVSSLDGFGFFVSLVPRQTLVSN